MAEPGEVCVYQFKVVLRGVSPMIWRRILLRSDQTIADLHYTIQIAMGWSDSHLNRFHIHGKDYGVAHEGGIWFEGLYQRSCHQPQKKDGQVSQGRRRESQRSASLQERRECVPSIQPPDGRGRMFI